jgi:tripartite-type tricarboxylate transporter receptor subunit TctC
MHIAAGDVLKAVTQALTGAAANVVSSFPGTCRHGFGTRASLSLQSLRYRRQVGALPGMDALNAGQNRIHLRPTIALLVSVSLAGSQANAQSIQKYPHKPVRMVLATTAGSQPDMIVRMIGQKLQESWGWPVVIDNRSGGGGVLAAVPVAKSSPDGHTLLYALPNFATSTALQPGLPYDPLKDFTGATHIGTSTNVLVGSTALGAQSVADLIAQAKAHPGKLIYASGTIGSASHLSGARLNAITGIKTVQVTFKGGPEATIELLAGRAHYHVGTMGVTLPFIKEGKLIALAVTSPQRAPVLPEVPALGEVFPEFKRPETSHGILAPAGTPRVILEQISREIARILEIPDIKERLSAISFVIAPSTPEEYSKILRGQIELLANLARDIGLKPR